MRKCSCRQRGSVIVARQQGFHYTNQTWFLPSLLLKEGELLALRIGMQAMNMYQGTPVAGTLKGGCGKTMVRLLFSALVAPFVSEKLWHPDQKLLLRKDGSLELALPTYAPEALLSWILSFGMNVAVLAPRSLRARLYREAKSMAAINKR